MNQRFGKEYRLCSQKIITKIFEEGTTYKSYPFLLKVLITTLRSESKFQIVISVPKRNFKKAVDRNLIRRRIKESIRKKKHLIEDTSVVGEKQLALFLIYNSTKLETYSFIENKIEHIIRRFIENKEE